MAAENTCYGNVPGVFSRSDSMLSISINTLWIVGLFLKGALLIVLTVSKVWRRFPIFTAYASSNFVFGVALYVVHAISPSNVTYFYLYWVSQPIGLVLGLGVIYEIFAHLFRPYPALRKLALLMFRVAVLVLVFMGCAAAYFQPRPGLEKIYAAFLAGEIGTRILQVGLLVFLFIFASVFGLYWRQYAFGIALGLGLYAIVQLVSVAARSQFGRETASHTFAVVGMVAFNSSLLIWLGYLLAPELAASRNELPRKAVLEQWNQALMELIQR